MSILLPSDPAPRTATPRVLDFGTTQTPPGGAPALRLNRLGNRFALDVELPPLDPDQRRVWVSRLIRALTEGALIEFPQPGFDPGAPGAIVVNGAGQQGSSLNLRGGADGYQFREGQFFSIIYGGRRYLHHAAQDWGANTAGMPISPMLRISPNDGAIVEVVTPMIEGFLSGNDLPWQLSVDHNADISFTITEAA